MAPRWVTTKEKEIARHNKHSMVLEDSSTTQDSFGRRGSSVEAHLVQCPSTMNHSLAGGVLPKRTQFVLVRTLGRGFWV